MKLTEEQLDVIAKRLCALATECQFMHDEALLCFHSIAFHDKSSFMVVAYLQEVLSRVDKLLDNLHCVDATLDGLLVQHKVLDDEEMI